MNNAIELFNDRAEPYFYLGLYCNRHKLFQKAYENLNKAYEMSYEDIKDKYPTADKYTYGKYVLDEYSKGYNLYGFSHSNNKLNHNITKFNFDIGLL